jgi:hypothetical protein
VSKALFQGVRTRLLATFDDKITTDISSKYLILILLEAGVGIEPAYTALQAAA